MKSTEVGGKFRLFNGQAQINASAFHIDWDNVQFVVPLPLCAFSYIANAATASSDGAELRLPFSVDHGGMYQPLVLITRRGDGGLDVLRRRVDVAVERELQRDVRRALARRRVQARLMQAFPQGGARTRDASRRRRAWPRAHAA